jgi:uncharacterized protein (TIGR00251 family)
MKWIYKYKNGVMLNLHVVPGAPADAISGEHGDALKIRLRAPPVEGKANKALVNLLADLLDVPRSNIVIVSGSGSRSKRVQVSEIDEVTVYTRLTSYMRNK